MDSNKIVEKTRLSFVISLAIGLLLLASGLAIRILEIPLLENNKAVVGLSFIPLALAAYFGITAALMKRNPKYSRSVSVEQTDERLSGLRHKADSITYRAMRWAISLVFLGYTLAFPSEIFESAGWWITFVFFFIAHMMQGVVLAVLMGRDRERD